METLRRRLVYFELSEGVYPAKKWLDGLKDRAARAMIRRRLARAESGNFGDWRSVGEGVLELRVHYGPGYRVYLGQDGPVLVVILAGSEKRHQHTGIEKAKRRWTIYQKRMGGRNA